LNFPNIHILLAHNKQENASDNLIAIKNIFLTTRIAEWFPEFIPKGKEWGNMSGFSVNNRTDKNRPEENIEAVGIGTEITGKHFQVAKKNDLVTEDSVTTDEQIKKTKSWDDKFNLGNFDDPKFPIQDYEGTRYHFSDLYSEKKDNPRIKVIEFPLLKDQNPDNIILDNINNIDRFNEQDVKFLKEDKGMWDFMCQLLLKPDDPAKRQFSKTMICYFNSVPNCNYYLLVDPASTRKKKSDFTVMLVVGVNKNRKYIVDGLRDKLDPKQRIDRALELAERWNIKGCGWESIAFQETDCYYLEEQRRLKKLWFVLDEIKSHKVAKEDRIRSLIPEYANHEWEWPIKGTIVKMGYDGRSYDLTQELEKEMMEFPLSEHDDLFDAQTFLNKISVNIPKEEEINEDKPMTFGDLHRLMDEKRNMRKDPWRELELSLRS
jgi:phage terminase large subunit-like protein